MATTPPAPAPLPPWIHATSGALSVVVASSLLYPIDTVRTKLQVQSKQDAKAVSEDQYYHSAFDAFVKIVKAEGISGLYVGLPGSLVAGAAQGFGFNFWHSFLRQAYIASPSLPQPPGTSAELTIAYFASAISALFTTPLGIVTTRQLTTPKDERKDIVGTAKEIINGPDGVLGLWKGFRATLLLCVNLAVTYGATERLRNLLFQGRLKLQPWESALLGVLSKGLATVITHPIVVGKVALVAKPPPSRHGVPYKSVTDVLRHIVKTEGVLQLWKGLGPGLSKSILFQGLLMIFKERSRVQLGVLYHYFKAIQAAQVKQGLESHLSNTTRPLIVK